MTKKKWFAFFGLLLLPETLWASTFTATQNMSFGTLIPLTTSGNATLSLSGSLNTEGSLTMAPSGTAPYQGIVTFQGTGLDSVLRVLTNSVLESSVTLRATGTGSGTVTIRDFTIDTSSSVSITNPNANIRVAGTLGFSSSATEGDYTGSVRIRTTNAILGTFTVNLPIILTLWSRLSISQSVPMHFGIIERLSGNSVIRLNPQNGIRTVISGAGGVNLGSGPPVPTQGTFTLSGRPNTTVSINLPSSISLTGSNGGTMTVNNFTKYPSTVTLNSSGNQSLYVGADLNVGASQISGTYTGTYTVTANY